MKQGDFKIQSERMDNGVYDEVADSPEKALLIFSRFNRSEEKDV